MTAQAYPLQWPIGWPRTPAGRRHRGSSFQVTPGQAIDDLFAELERLGAKNIVLSSNLMLTNAMRPYASQKQPDDPGIAVFFTLKDKQMVMARDGFADWRDNIRSLGLAVQAFRALHRHGGAQMMERAFQGFAALPDLATDWRRVLGLDDDVRDLSVVEARYMLRRGQTHPDRGGSGEEFNRVQRAWEDAQRELSP